MLTNSADVLNMKLLAKYLSCKTCGFGEIDVEKYFTLKIFLALAT